MFVLRNKLTPQINCFCSENQINSKNKICRQASSIKGKRAIHLFGASKHLV
jgi:hypothetical protein